MSVSTDTNMTSVDVSKWENNYEAMYRAGDGTYHINGLSFSSIAQAARYVIDDSADGEEYRIEVLLSRIQLLNAQIKEANYWLKVYENWESQMADDETNEILCYECIDEFYTQDLGAKIEWSEDSSNNGNTGNDTYDTYSESTTVTTTWVFTKAEMNILISTLDSFASKSSSDIQSITVSMNAAYDLHDEFKNLSGNIIDRVGSVVQNLVSLLRS